jgi:cell shape-determining protein MreC
MFGPGEQTYATVTGQGAGEPLSVLYVPSGAAVHTGEVMYTNGLAGGSLPKGLPVGVVRSVHQSPGSGSETVTLNPSADLSALAYVDVLQWEPGL